MTRGSLIGLGAGAGGAVLVLLVAVYLVARGCGGDEPRAARGPDHASEIGSAGMTARGTDELRAAGCVNAVVVDMAQLLGSAAKVREDEPRIMVTCDVGAGAAPSCDALVSTYLRALGAAPEGNVSVRVVAPAGHADGRRAVAGPQTVCSRLYAPSGADLGPFPRLP